MKKLQLLLTNPCSGNWDKMQLSKAGRYCDVCTKHIVDLTTKSDAALIDFFKNKKANVCGRLLSTQINRELVMPPQKSNWHWLLPIALGASTVTTVQAAATKPVMVQHDNLFLSPPTSPSHTSEVAKVDTVKGKVIDGNTGKPLAGVRIKKKPFNNVAALTDNAGNFSLAVTAEEKAATLVFGLDGYETTEKIIIPGLVVKMTAFTETKTIMLGGISAVHTTREPLYVVYSGNKSCTLESTQFKTIQPEWIEKIEVLKGDAKTAALYGSRAVNGVILVGIKDEFSSKVKFSKKK